MDYFQAFVLAVIQGITEFLPVSSSAHLILVPSLLGWEDQGLAFDVAVHVGTLVAVVAFLRHEIAQIMPAWFRGWAGFNWDEHGRLGWAVLLGTIPVGLVGLLGHDFIEQNLRHTWVIGLSTLVFGLLLGWVDRKGDTNTRGLTDMTRGQALWVGCAQAIALIPGTSRSGITMTALLMLGYSRIAAARFSFLLAVPAIALPGLLKAKELSANVDIVAWDVLGIGIVVSAVTAFVCMHFFMRFIEKVGMKPFVIYRILLAIVIFALVS